MIGLKGTIRKIQGKKEKIKGRFKYWREYFDFS